MLAAAFKVFVVGTFTAGRAVLGGGGALRQARLLWRAGSILGSVFWTAPGNALFALLYLPVFTGILYQYKIPVNTAAKYEQL